MLLNSSGLSPLTESGGFIPAFTTGVRPKGIISPTVLRKDGREEVIPSSHNGVTTLGYNYMLDAPFRAGIATTYPYWYIGLIASAGWTGGNLQVTDTPASHPTWTEDSTHYTPVVVTGAVNNGAGYASSTTTMTVDGFSAAITAGTPFTVTGLTGTYVVTSVTGGATPTAITFTPGLASSVLDNAVINMGQGRPIWTPGAASAKAISNPTSTNFAINTDNSTIKGVFIVSDPTLNGSLGLMWSTGLFSSDQTLFSGDMLRITYQISLS